LASFAANHYCRRSKTHRRDYLTTSASKTRIAATLAQRYSVGLSVLPPRNSPMSDQASALNAMRMIDLLIEFFGPVGEHWLQGDFRQGRERRCLVDAVGYLRRKNRISGDGASWHIYEAIRPRELPAPAKSLWTEALLRDRLMAFNDAYCNSFAELRAVLIKARIRAAREFCHAAAQTDAERQAGVAAAKAAAARKEEAAAARKRQLLAELARERMVRHAAGDKRKTYILTPRPPAPHSVSERLAA
jgi:hypothetical protein